MSEASTSVWRTGPVAVTGGDGHVGRRLQARLAGLPNEVRPLGRDDDLVAAFTGVDAVVHLAGTLAPRRGDSFEAANVDTVRRTLSALAGSSARRLVFLSYPGADPAAGNEYLRCKGEAEGLVLACGRDAVVMRCTFIYGPPDDPGPSAAPFLSHANKPVCVIGDGRQLYAPVYVEDVVEALTRFALDPATPTGTFGLAGPDILTADAFADTLSGHDVRERHIPRGVARALAHVVPTLTPTTADVLAADSLPDGCPPAAEALGLQLRRLADHYPYALERAGV